MGCSLRHWNDHGVGSPVDRSWKHRTATYYQNELQTTHISRLLTWIKACIQAMILQGLRFQVRLSREMNLRDRNCAVLVFSDCGCWVVLIMTLDWLLKSSRPGEKQSHLQSGLGVTSFNGKICSGGVTPWWNWVSCIQLSSISDDSRLWLCADFITQPLRMGQQNQLLCLVSGSLGPPGKGNTHFYFIWPWESYRLTSLQANFFFFLKEEDPGHLPGSVS